jgi:energy-coupling factor transporter ATP-binding protein EcfA2
MTNQLHFDSSLLSQPWKDRMQFFRLYMVKHRRLEQVDKDIMAIINEPAGASFMFVVGPTGSGKTTVLEVVYQRLINQAMDEMITDPGYLPVARLEASTINNRSYNWHDHWTRSLYALSEPLVKHKKLLGESCTVVTTGMRLREQSAALRRSFENAAQMRRLITFFIDEAHHLTHVPAKLLRSQLETIKSGASLSKAFHVLYGTYELLLLRNASGQLGRRAVTVHFERYRADSDEDVLAFAEVVQSFQVHMPLVETPDLLPHLEYCFERSLGCIGLLKDWFSRALADVLEKNGKTLTYRDLQKHEYPASVLLIISSEFLQGERLLLEEESTFALIKERLRISTTHKNGKQAGAKTQAKKQKHTFAKRKPKRDKVGEGRVS